MFERDVQGTLDDYLRGRLTESVFLEHARPWKNYAADYRPMVEFAREQQLDVLAANVPRALASKVARGEPLGPDVGSLVARQTTADRDGYWERFQEVMREHQGTDGDADKTYRYFQSQCLKDDSMAESISDYLACRPHAQPLVVHLCGRFHSDFGGGVVMRLLKRRPLAHVAVISMEAAEDPAKVKPSEHRDRGHFQLCVPKPPKQEPPAGDESTDEASKDNATSKD